MGVCLSKVLLLGVLLVVRSSLAQGNATDAPEKALIHTSVTGSIQASGLDDPQYVLSFVPIQRLMLEAAQHPLKQAEIQRAVQTTPVTLDRLLELGLLRRDEDAYRLNYLLLTVQDQRTMYSVSARYGSSLANAFQDHKAEFDAIASHYRNAELRPQLLFALVAGAAMNWGGLGLTTELGYRVQPRRHEKGGTYIVHSAENGANLDFTGLYLDSETAPGSKMSFSTFGDGTPRLQGLPDVFEGLESAVADWQRLPAVYAALRSEYISLILLAIDDAGQVMSAVADGIDTDEGLAKTLALPEDRRKNVIALLVSIGYLRELDHHYAVGVPVITEADKLMVDAILKLSREIMTTWLRANYPAMEKELSGLSPMRNGLPFSLAFNEVWHYEFGFATKFLAEGGFYANPHAPGNRHEGYVPLIWASSVLKGPGE